MLVSANPRTLQQAADAARQAGERAGRDSMRAGGRREFNPDDEQIASDVRLRMLREFGFVDERNRPTHRHRRWQSDRHAPFTLDPRELAAVDASIGDAHDLAGAVEMLAIEGLSAADRELWTKEGRAISQRIIARADAAGMDIKRLLGLCEERLDARRHADAIMFGRRAA